MGANFFTNYYEAAAIVIFGIGFTLLFFSRNLIKKVIGFNFMDSGIFLFLAAKGYIRGRVSPIIVDGVTEAAHYINPVPAGLVLTGIVVSVSVTAFLLALTVRLYRKYRTLDLDEIIRRAETETETEAEEKP